VLARFWLTLCHLVRTCNESSRIQASRLVDFSTTVQEIREFVERNMIELRGLLRQDPSRSKGALPRYFGQMVLTPRATPSGPVYEVSGGIDLLGGRDVMPVVARDGIEWHYITLPLDGILLNPAA